MIKIKQLYIQGVASGVPFQTRASYFEDEFEKEEREERAQRQAERLVPLGFTAEDKASWDAWFSDDHNATGRVPRRKKEE